MGRDTEERERRENDEAELESEEESDDAEVALIIHKLWIRVLQVYNSLWSCRVCTNKRLIIIDVTYLFTKTGYQSSHVPVH